MKKSKVPLAVLVADGEVDVVVDEDDDDGLASSGTLNLPASSPKADKTIRTTMAIKISPIKHIKNLSVYIYLKDSSILIFNLAKYLMYF